MYIKILIVWLLVVSLPAEARSKRKSVTKLLTRVIVSAPKDNEVCFSPVEPCDAKLVKFIESATKSVDVAIYDINLDSLGHAILLKAHSIPVRIVVDQRQAHEKNSIVGMLIKAAVNVRIGHQRGIMHNKYVVVDGARVETGSFNYTNHATQANNENQVYLSTPEIVSRYKDRFNVIWNEATPGEKLAGR